MAVSQNMQNILNQYQSNVTNLMNQSNRPTYDTSKITPMPTGDWVQGWNPTTANPTTKGALTTIKNNAWADAGQGLLHGLGTALDIIDRPRNAVDTAIANIGGGHSVGDVLHGAWQGLTGQKHTSFSDLMDNWGWHKSGNWSIKDPLDISHGGRALVSFLGDVATDPITYATFGEGGVIENAAKAALKPFVDRGLAEAAQKGAVQGTKEFADIMANHTQSDIAQNAMKAAQANASKSAVSVGLPFGQKYSILNKPQFMQKTTQTVAPEAAQSLAMKMGGAGLTDQARYDLMSHMIGSPVTSGKNLNTQEYDFINNLWHDTPTVNGVAQPSFGEKVASHFGNAPDPFGGVSKPANTAARADREAFVNTHHQNVFGTPAPQLSKMSDTKLNALMKQMDTQLKSAKATQQATHYANALANAKNDFNSLGKQYVHHDGLTGFSPLTKKLFVNGAGDTTKLGKMQEGLGNFFGSKRFVSTANQIRDHRTAGVLGHIVGANNKAYAYSHQFIQQLRKASNTPEFKSLTPDDWKEVAYTIEGQRPTHAGYTAPTPAKQAVIDKVARSLVGDSANPNADYFMKGVNDLEAKAGVVHGGNTQGMNYFPHMYNLPNNEDFNALKAHLVGMGNRGQQIQLGMKYGTSGFQKARAEFKTMADLQDALHGAQQSGSKDAKKFLEDYKNVSWNPLEAYGKRAIVGMNQVAKHEAIREATKAGQVMHNVPDGWKTIESTGLAQNSPLHALVGKAVPPEIHKDLTSVNKLLTSSEDLNNFMDKVDRVMSVLRRNYTVTKLGFHTRQSIGNVFQNTLAGIKPSAYGKAGRYIANPDKYPQWTKELLENGILHTGSANADLAHNIGTELNNRMSAGHIGSMLNPIHKNFALGKAGRAAGEYEDNMARVAHYIGMRDKGLNPEQAANSVRKYLFNYAEANNVTRGIRMAIPFYQWMRNNLPFQLMQLSRSPKTYNMAQNFLKDFQNEPSGKDAMSAAGINNSLDQATMQKVIDENGGVLPGYIKDNYIDVTGNGNYFNVGLPTQDLKALANNPAQYFFGGLNPYINLINEMNHNENSLNGAPIDKSVPTGESIWGSALTPFSAGFNHIGETAIGSPYQLAEGQISKGLGVNTQNMDFTKQLQILASQKAKDLSTRAKYLKQQAANGGS